MAMTLKTVVEILNRNGTHNNFKLTELAAKRSAPHDDRTWVVVRFHNTKGNWKDFTTYRVELYEAIPHGWPLSDVACRLGCHEEELRIVAQRINGKWHPLRDRAEAFKPRFFLSPHPSPKVAKAPKPSALNAGA